MKDFRSFDVFREAAAARERKLKLKKKRKSGACCGSSLRKLRGLLVDRKRKKRVAGYNLYSVKGRVKVTLRESLRWFKRKCAGLAYGLCGIRSRKRSPRHPPPGAAHIPKTELGTATTVEATNQQPSAPAAASPATTADEPISMSPLPPPPAVTAMHLEASMEKGAREWTERQRRLKSSSVNWNAAKQTLLLVSPSTRMLPRSLSVRQWVEDQHQKKKLGKHRTEDSIWTKTIILGERCQVPDEDDANICDKKGNRISAYHPRNPQSVPVSRSTSFIDPATII